MNNHGWMDDPYWEDYLWDMAYYQAERSAKRQPAPERSQYATDDMIVLHEVRPTVDNAVAVR